MYKELAKTAKYAVVQCPTENLYRVENRKGLYADEIPHIEIPKDLAEYYVELLKEYMDYPRGEKAEAKASGIAHFNELCDLDFENEHAELYPEQYA